MNERGCVLHFFTILANGAKRKAEASRTSKFLFKHINLNQENLSITNLTNLQLTQLPLL